jgi:D-arabinose 1-dehydrogenase-like Zn-dependent alcohol dehydrogenase
MPSFTVYRGSKDGSIHESTTHRPDLTDDEVLVRVTASGVCGTDEHYRTIDMGLGHEGAGIVESVGPSVQKMAIGDRVGWGYIHGSCGNCKQCLNGKENLCAERKQYGNANLDQGSFASHGVWREAFLFRIPDGLSDEAAAPLMCGGATVFGALRLYDIPPTTTIGIVGVGGLGHLAIQFARKMGADVVVFSGTDSKREEAIKLGANEFYATKGLKKLDMGARKLDVLIVTTSFQPGKSDRTKYHHRSLLTNVRLELLPSTYGT